MTRLPVFQGNHLVYLVWATLQDLWLSVEHLEKTRQLKKLISNLKIHTFCCCNDKSSIFSFHNNWKKRYLWVNIFPIQSKKTPIKNKLQRRTRRFWDTTFKSWSLQGTAVSVTSTPEGLLNPEQLPAGATRLFLDRLSETWENPASSEAHMVPHCHSSRDYMELGLSLINEIHTLITEQTGSVTCSTGGFAFKQIL